ncbi:MAG TPA: serine protease, partial [Chitinophagaceae bacterium]|nr:serine protease [Chitinophagaceae bacterium]
MEDIQLLEAVERYIRGEMKTDERVYFEQLRKTNPEVDQMVVEHTLFIHQMNEVGELRKFKSTLNEVHIDLAEKGLINSDRLKGKAKVVYMWRKYKRVAMIAAFIAGITTLTISLLVWSATPKVPQGEFVKLSRDLDNQKKITTKLAQDVNVVKNAVKNTMEGTKTPVINYKTGGTGFLIDVKGYLVTNAHVVEGATNIAVQRANGKDFNAEVVFTDKERDIAILKIKDASYKPTGSIPYSISKSSAELAAPIFTLGYPKDDIVYNEGYLSSKKGFHGDSLSCQIAIEANTGNSGSPILNKNGEVIGVLNGRQANAQGFTFAIHSKYIYSAIEELKKKDT